MNALTIVLIFGSISKKGEKMMAGNILRRNLTRLPVALLVAVLAIALSACSGVQSVPSAQQFDSDIATKWFGLSLELVQKTPGFSPPVASRVFAYLGITLYETVQPGIAGSSSLAGQLNELESMPVANKLERYHWPAAANAALASMTRRLFANATPEMVAAIDALEASNAAEFASQEDAATLQRSVAWGLAVADAIYLWSMNDGGHEGYLRNVDANYTSPVGVGMWISTPPNYAPPLQPHWGKNRPFVLHAADACPAPPPPAYSEEPDSEFYADAFEVYEVGRQRTEEQTAIALFWADDAGRTATPPGHWISILGQVLDKENATLDIAAEAYARVGIAVADAFITCWHTKYIYHVVRPITYIQKVIDPNWNNPEITDPVLTPPFPEYTSGHSVQSGAAAAVLTALFGEDYAFTDHTHDALGLPPRAFDSFRAAAEEAAISRLYGGIHYRAAIENGLAQGQCIAEKVLALELGPEL